MKKSKNKFKQKDYTRAIVVSLDQCTKHKRTVIAGMIRAYRLAVNAYIVKMYHSCLNIKGNYELNKDTLDLLPNHYFGLSQRYKSQACKQALEVMASLDNKKSEVAYQIKHNRRKAACPNWQGYPVLDSKFIKINEAEAIVDFDFVARLSTFKSKKLMDLPFKSHTVLNKWLAQPNASLLDGCELHADKLILYVKVAQGKIIEGKKPYKELVLDKIFGTREIKPHEVWGMDTGINKLMVLTNANSANPETQAKSLFLGLWQHALLDKRLGKKRGSKAYRKATQEFQTKMEMELNHLPWDKIKVLVVEQLKHIKHKKTYKKLLLWCVSWLYERLENKCVEHRVLLVKVSPKYTSQTCPTCRVVEKRNRKGEVYLCDCNQVLLDADFTGGYNIRRKFLEADSRCTCFNDSVSTRSGIESLGIKVI